MNKFSRRRSFGAGSLCEDMMSNQNQTFETELLRQLSRIADSLATLATQQNQVKAPNLFRDIGDYPTFDWAHEIPGCRIVARDRSGPTEVFHEGHTYRRYRSSDEDVKGVDIRYRCVVSGTVEAKNMVWATLIKFGVPRKVKPLSNVTRETMEERAATTQTTPSQQPPSSPATSPTPPPAPPPLPEPSLYDQLKAAHDQALDVIGQVPLQFLPMAGATPEEIARMIEGLNGLTNEWQQPTVARTAEERQTFLRLCKQHSELIDLARQNHVTLAEHLFISPTDTNQHLEMKVTTLSNRLASFRKPTGASASAPATAPSQPATSGQANSPVGVRPPEQTRAWIVDRVQRYKGTQTPLNLKTRVLCVETINAATEDKAPAVVRFLFGRAINELRHPETQALYDYLKPARTAGGPVPTNLSAAAELSAIARQVSPAAQS